MEDFLYILLLVAWVVFSIYNKNRKKKQSTTRSKPLQEGESHEHVAQKPRSILEQLLLGEEPQPMPYEEHEQASDFEINDSYGDEVVKQGSNKEISDAEIAAKYDFDPSKEGDSYDVPHEEISDISEENENEREVEFDLKQAVIFSEILKRPYAN